MIIAIIPATIGPITGTISKTPAIKAKTKAYLTFKIERPIKTAIPTIIIKLICPKNQDPILF